MMLTGLLKAGTPRAALLLSGGAMCSSVLPKGSLEAAGSAEETNVKRLAANAFPAQFAIDWIRGYRCTNDPDTGRACM
ncbi:hypothetical protein [Erythrobacter sp.]|uniref:hypothetical protein n=1 Tax=Erythrobacter sp. TaxID=1042 RepID=UPI0025CF447F|nr:hypothetical protein [Erythrobacter sp.]